MDDLNPFEQKVYKTIQKYSMLRNGDRIIAAVSGGADSMALLTVFNAISRITTFNFTVAHVNHGIRGMEADRDEDFVRSCCARSGIPFVSAHYDVPVIASETGEGIEECGRRLRYAFFKATDPEAKTATAHNLNDCEETFLLNLARGSSLHGLTGIPPVRGNIIRPLIECSRAEIEDYLKAKGVTYVTDSTNLSDDYSRNKIRHNVIPVLKTLNPDFDTAFLNCTECLKSDDDELDRQAQEVFEKSKTPDGFTSGMILSLPPAIRGRVLIRIFRHFGCSEPGYRHVSVFDETGSVNLPGNITIGTYRGLIIKRSEQESTGQIKIVSVAKEDIRGLTLKELSQRGYADKDRIKSAVIRTRQPGDRFLPPGGSFTRSLKKMFAENSVPADKRGIALIMERDNVILYAEGIGTSAYAVPDENTTETVRISPDGN